MKRLVDNARSIARLTVGVVLALRRGKHKVKTVGSGSSGSYECQQTILEASAEGDQARDDQAEMQASALHQWLRPPFKTMIGGTRVQYSTRVQPVA